MRQNADKMMLRLPDGLRDRVKMAAKRNHRSMNAEVVFHLERVFGESATPTAGDRPQHPDRNCGNLEAVAHERTGS